MQFRVPAEFSWRDHGLSNIYAEVNVYIEAEFVDRRSGGWVYEAEVDNISSEFHDTIQTFQGEFELKPLLKLFLLL